MQCKLVLPGDVVGPAEEYLPGEGTYLKGGNVCALATGKTQIDRNSRSANVITTANGPTKISVGDVVVGRVVNIRDSFAIVVLAFKRKCESRPIFNTEGTLHISNINSTYVKDIHQVLGIRDILKAKIIDGDRPSLSLSTKDKDMGVIKAYCSKCNSDLRLENGKLLCQNCGNVESRKLSTDYGLGVVR